MSTGTFSRGRYSAFGVATETFNRLLPVPTFNPT